MPLAIRFAIAPTPISSSQCQWPIPASPLRCSPSHPPQFGKQRATNGKSPRQARGTTGQKADSGRGEEATNGKWAQKGHKGEMPRKSNGEANGQKRAQGKCLKKSERKAQMGHKGGQKPEEKQGNMECYAESQISNGNTQKKGDEIRKNSGESLGGSHRGEGTVLEEAANPWRAKCNRRSGEARGWGGDQNIARAVPICIAMMFLWD
ncbi:hypothetical protein niasHT_016557 [Heterodera trifolii]|uniref:Uncharacterized protein n=1 Tax=Heterodera trifolii TaxID=157864 RepID=A0ABD2LKD9_9BILA